MSKFRILEKDKDPIALRLSIGGEHDGTKIDGEYDGYIVYRGDVSACIELLKKAIKSLEAYKEVKGV